MKLGLVDAQGHVAHDAVLPSAALGVPGVFVEQVGRSIEALARAAGTTPRRLRGVGIGAPGVVDVRRGIVHSCVNVPRWREVPLSRLMERRLSCRCAVDNDANLVTLGEWRFGAGVSCRNMVCVTLGTGVGGGIVIDGQLYRGASGSAGELGHMITDPAAGGCVCGAAGCLEAQIGTRALIRQARRALRHPAGVLRNLIRRSGGRITPELISQAAAAGDGAAREIWSEFGRRLGIGVATVVNALNPERLVIGGGVANAWRWFWPSLKASMQRCALTVPAQAARIVRARLGPRAGVIGAAVLIGTDSHR